MEDKLVTLAIRTYTRAQMIKSVLEENGIDTVIHSLNLEQPGMDVGVRVRINQKDLPRALKIVEDMESAWEEKKDVTTVSHVLIPIDFGDQIPKMIDFGFYFADILAVEVVFLYAYFSPAFTISMNNDVSTYSISDSELLRRIISTANNEMELLGNNIKKRIVNGELPNIPFRFELKEGVPEDQILDYCKKNNPALVIMGTRGKKIDNEVIGSVTAEVMESCVSPVFAVPVQMQLKTPEEIQRVAFLTNFDQKDLIAIDRTISLFNSGKLEIFFIHASEKNEAWDEVMLGGIKSYFSNHYPTIRTHYALLGNSYSPEIIEEYMKEKNIDVLAFNTRRRRLLSRLFNPGMAYKMVLYSDIPLFVTHV
ncbi:MAG: universal stress protein [Paludibacter sp.]|nr:universal stress protein [Paludibacter sp.]